jgi:hypothetical protein
MKIFCDKCGQYMDYSSFSLNDYAEPGSILTLISCGSCGTPAIMIKAVKNVVLVEETKDAGKK